MTHDTHKHVQRNCYNLCKVPTIKWQWKLHICINSHWQNHSLLPRSFNVLTHNFHIHLSVWWSYWLFSWFSERTLIAVQKKLHCTISTVYSCTSLHILSDSQSTTIPEGELIYPWRVRWRWSTKCKPHICLPVWCSWSSWVFSSPTAWQPSHQQTLPSSNLQCQRQAANHWLTVSKLINPPNKVKSMF